MLSQLEFKENKIKFINHDMDEDLPAPYYHKAQN